MANNQNEFSHKFKKLVGNRAVIVTVVTLLVVTGIVVAATISANRAKKPPVETPVETDNGRGALGGVILCVVVGVVLLGCGVINFLRGRKMKAAKAAEEEAEEVTEETEEISEEIPEEIPEEATEVAEKAAEELTEEEAAAAIMEMMAAIEEEPSSEPTE